MCWLQACTYSLHTNQDTQTQLIWNSRIIIRNSKTKQEICTPFWAANVHPVLRCTTLGEVPPQTITMIISYNHHADHMVVTVLWIQNSSTFRSLPPAPLSVIHPPTPKDNHCSALKHNRFILINFWTLYTYHIICMSLCSLLWFNIILMRCPHVGRCSCTGSFTYCCTPLYQDTTIYLLDLLFTHLFTLLRINIWAVSNLGLL